MAVNGKTELQNLIPEVWSSQMYDELRESLILGNFFFRDYEGEIANVGDTVKVNQIIAPDGQETTDDKALIEADEMTVNQKEVKAQYIARAAFEITNISWLQSLSFQEEAREALVYSIMSKMENRLITLATNNASSTLSPSSASSLAQGDVAALRTALSKNKVPRSGRGLFLDPDYFGDILGTNFASSDFIPAGSPAATGDFSTPLYGFNVAEHNRLTSDFGISAHRTAIAVVMQNNIEVDLVDMKPAKKDGWMLVAKMIYGCNVFDSNRIVNMSG